MGPNSKLPVRQGSAESAASALQLCGRTERGGAHSAALQLPIGFLLVSHHVLPDGLLGQLLLRLEPAKPNSLRHRLRGWTGGGCPEYQVHFGVTIDCVFLLFLLQFY